MANREATLRKMDSPLARKGGERWRDGEIPDIDWSIIGQVCDGLAFANRPLRAATHRVTREYDLGPRGAFILNVISNGLLYPLELASVFKAGRSLITIELARLTRAGLIVSRPGSKDRRRTELALTALGKVAAQQVRDDMSEIVRTHLRGYSREQILLFCEMLHDVRGNLPTTCR